MAANTLNDWQHAWLRIREFAAAWQTQRQYICDNSSSVLSAVWADAAMRADKIALDPDMQQGLNIGMQNWRAAFSSALSASAGRGVIDPLLIQISRAMGYPQTDPFAVFPILTRYMALNQGSFKSQPLVESRTFTRGSWTAGGTNVGNGTVYRLNVDAYGYPRESDNPDILKFRCLVDANSGANPGQEQFAVNGLPFQDNLVRYATGFSVGLGQNLATKNLVGVAADNSRSYITNPSFSDSSGSGATFTLTGWTLASGSLATCSIDTVNYYRKSNAETTPGALKTTATVAFKQKIPANKLDSTLAYLGQAACNFSVGGATGSVRMRIGTEAAYVIDVTVNSGVAGWNTILPAQDKKLWFQNFSGSNDIYVRFDITLSSGTSILLDDFSFDAFQNIGGKLLWAVGGSTPWVLNDTATLTDTVPLTDNSIPITTTPGCRTQTLLAELYGRSLPSTSFSTKPAAPSASATSGGTGAKGRLGIVTTFYNGTTLLESRPCNEINLTLDGTNDRISLTGVVTGPAGTTDRYIYVTQLDDFNDTANLYSTGKGPQSAYYFVAAMGDNVATTKTVDPKASTDLTKPLSTLADIT